MAAFLRDIGASPGRSGHRLAIEAERVRFGAREAVAELFGSRDPKRVIFTAGATMALNLVIQGLLPPGAHAVTTGVEHNSVLRPLRALEGRGVSVTVVPCRPDGTLEAAAVEEPVRAETRLILVNHASNVCGTVLPIREIGALARERGIPFLVDTAQTGGCWPIGLEDDDVDLLIFSGHKGLLGPCGTGGLVIHERFDVSALPPLIQGGTGSRSEHEVQPEFLPDRFEAGTPNNVGLAGLAAAVRYVMERGVAEIRRHERRLTQRLIDGLRGISGVEVQGTGYAGRQTAAVSFTIAHEQVSGIAHQLDERFAILCRPGLHCAPQAHRTLGTFPDGTVRLAPGAFNTEAEIDRAIDAVTRLAGG
jgi:cysteine desulfurase family protein